MGLSFTDYTSIYLIKIPIIPRQEMDECVSQIKPEKFRGEVKEEKTPEKVTLLFKKNSLLFISYLENFRKPLHKHLKHELIFCLPFMFLSRKNNAQKYRNCKVLWKVIISFENLTLLGP